MYTSFLMMPTMLVGTVASVFAIVNGVTDTDDEGDDSASKLSKTYKL